MFARKHIDLLAFQAGKFRVSTRKEDVYLWNFCLCLNRPLSFPFAVFLSSFAWNEEEIRLAVLHFNGRVCRYFAIQRKNIQMFADIFYECIIRVIRIILNLVSNVMSRWRMFMHRKSVRNI